MPLSTLTLIFLYKTMRDFNREFNLATIRKGKKFVMLAVILNALFFCALIVTACWAIGYFIK